EAEIAMHRGQQRAARVQHQRDASGGEAGSVARNLPGELWAQLAEDLREIDAGFFEDAAFKQNPRASAAAAGPLPTVFTEAAAVDFFQRRADALLQTAEIVGSALVHVASPAWGCRYCAQTRRIGEADTVNARSCSSP